MVDTTHPDTNIVDATLRSEADKLAGTAPTSKAPRGSYLDGYQIVEAATGKVFDWGPWLPIFLPQDVRLPRLGYRFFLDGGDLYILRTDTDGRLLATSMILVGPVLWMAVVGVAVFVIGSGATWLLSRRSLRAYFALRALQLPTLEEALRSGENQRVEFKRRISDDPDTLRTTENEVLKTIAAFANTNDGLILIGVDDGGQIVGLNFDFRQKDRLEQKIRQLTRSKIKPTPPIQVGFEDVRGLGIAKITVARGADLAYMISGVIYVRDGSSDVQAQPEDLRRLMGEYAL